MFDIEEVMVKKGQNVPIFVTSPLLPSTGKTRIQNSSLPHQQRAPYLVLNITEIFSNTIVMDRNSKTNTLFEPTILKVPQSTASLVQVSVHSVMSKAFIREAAYVFPEQNLNDLIVIHTMQHARLNMVSFGEDVENEKDRLIKSVPYALCFLS